MLLISGSPALLSGAAHPDTARNPAAATLSLATRGGSAHPVESHLSWIISAGEELY